MKRSIIIAGVLAGMMALTGCRSTEVISTEIETEVTQADQITMTESETPESEGRLVLAVAEEGSPYIFEKDGEMTGIVIETAQAAAEAMNMELVIEAMPADAFRSALLAGRCDLVAAGSDIAETEDESDNEIYRSADFITDRPVLIVRAGSSIDSADELSDAVVGVQLRGRGDKLVSKYHVAEVVRYNQASRAVAALQEEKTDAVVLSAEQAEQLISAADELEIIEDAYGQTFYSFQVLRENQDLTSRLAETLNELTDQGKIKEITEKYINAE